MTMCAIVCALVFGGLSTAASADPVWTTPVAVSTQGYAINENAIASSSDGLSATAVWSTVVPGNSSSGITWASTTRDGGATWSARKFLNILPSQSQVFVSTDGQRIVVMMAVANGRVYAQRSTDGGTTWLPLASMPVVTTENYNNVDVDSSADCMTLVATWRSKPVNNVTTISMSRSTDGGATWSAPRVLSQVAKVATASDVDVSADGQHVVVAYRQMNDANMYVVYTRHSVDGGITWGIAHAVSAAGVRIGSFSVAIADRGGAGWLMWQDTGELNAAVSTDSGASWRNVGRVSTAGVESGYPKVLLAADGTSGIAVWLQLSANNYLPSASRLDASTSTWSAAVDISGGSGIGAVLDSPFHVGTSASTLVTDVTWMSSEHDNPTMRVATTSNGGTSWSPLTTPLASSKYTLVPNVTLSSDGTRSAFIAVATESSNAADMPLFAMGMSDSGRVDPAGGAGSGASGQAAVPLLSQVPTPSISLPATLKKHGWSRVLRVPIPTNAGQYATVTATAVVTKTGAIPSRRDFRTKTKVNGTAKVFKVRLSGRKKLTVNIAVTAPETATYDDFAMTKSYTMRKSKR